MNFEIVVFPYRDIYFANKFGWSVRDLSIIKSLEKSDRVSSLRVVQRPVSIYERLLGKWKNICKNEGSKMEILDFTSFDLVGPFSGRSWTHKLYNKFLSKILTPTDLITKSNEKLIKVVLDFTPIASIPYKDFSGHIIWYDLIDNFSKHNRFSLNERNLVNKKYSYVNNVADLITAVTVPALTKFDPLKSLVMSNGLSCGGPILDVDSKCKYDLGFIGFVTDKFDVDLIERLATVGKFKIAIYGDVYDRAIGRKLKSIRNVSLKGKFHDDNVGNILATFEIGLIPYLGDKSHDGSPIKLYQYLLHGKQVISTIQYTGESDQFGKMVYITNEHPAAEHVADIHTMLDEATLRGLSFSKLISNMVSEELFWDHKVNMALDRLEAIAVLGQR